MIEDTKDAIEEFSSNFVRAVAGDDFETPVGPAILELAQAVRYLADVIRPAPGDDDVPISAGVKRDLAALLLRSANEAEGHPEGAPNEDGSDGGKL